MKKLQRLATFITWVRKEHLKKEPVQQVYDGLSKGGDYDGVVDFDTRSESFKPAIQHLDFKNKDILDLACGTGAFLNALPISTVNKMTGVDLSSGMLEIAKKRFAHLSNLEFINKSFMEVDFNAEEFDYILMANASRYIPQGQESIFFNNVKKWLKKDGVFIIISDNITWNTNIGGVVSSIILKFMDKDKSNPNTTYEAQLIETLKKYFVIDSSKRAGAEEVMFITHKAILCRKKASY